jgi:uncharacterized sporulation protein YeaH/YhbH (DUF444 family)
MKTKEFAGMTVECDEDGIQLTREQAQELERKLAIAHTKRKQNLSEFIEKTKAKTAVAFAEIRRLQAKIDKLEKQPAGRGGGAIKKKDIFIENEPNASDPEAQGIYQVTQANKDAYDDHTKKWNPKP